MTNRRELTPERLRELLRYDPETGLFWRKGVVAGALRPDGYVTVSVDGQRYYAHRLAWFYMTGEWPSQDIDHGDRQKNNNQWVNLREATRSQNSANSKRRSTNKSGKKGVFLHQQTNRWYSQITVCGRVHNLGLFASIEEAAEAYRQAAETHFGSFANTGDSHVPS